MLAWEEMQSRGGTLYPGRSEAIHTSSVQTWKTGLQVAASLSWWLEASGQDRPCKIDLAAGRTCGHAKVAAQRQILPLKTECARCRRLVSAGIHGDEYELRAMLAAS